MKFDRLFKIVTESLSSPKNKGGARVYAAQQSAGPGGYSTSPVGKTDALEVQKPLKRWEFNPDSDTDKKGGISEQSKAWKTLTTALSLLANDDNFKTAVESISKKFDKRRDSFKLNFGVTDEEGKITEFKKYDEESRINNLPQTIDKQKGKRAGLEQELNKLNIIRNYTKMSPGEKIQLKKVIASLKGEASVIEKELLEPNLSRIKKEKFTDELFKINTKLGRAEDKLNWAENKDRISVDSDILKLHDDIKELDKKITKNEEELKVLTDRTTKIQTNNEENNDLALDEIKDQVKLSAKRIKNDLSEQIKETQYTEDEGVDDVDDISTVDWTNIPKQFKQKVLMLDSLISDDPSINPIFGYIDSFNNWYYEFDNEGGKSRVKDLDSREFNPQLNITKIRDYSSLPFVRLMSIYANASIPKFSLKKEADLAKHAGVYTNFVEYIRQYPNSKDPTIIQQQREDWNSEEVKEMLRGFLAGMAVENKQLHYDRINGSFSVTRSGFNSFNQLKSGIDTDMKRFQPANESFDAFVNRIINEKAWDDDDFKLDTMEILSLMEKKSNQCTGPTKKASSPKTDKKWTKCAKQSDGSYKRIHWGDPNAKVTGKSGNTKRKKAFRARHNCNSAKQGSAQQAACADW